MSAMLTTIFACVTLRLPERYSGVYILLSIYIAYYTKRHNIMMLFIIHDCALQKFVSSVKTNRENSVLINCSKQPILLPTNSIASGILMA